MFTAGATPAAGAPQKIPMGCRDTTGTAGSLACFLLSVEKGTPAVCYKSELLAGISPLSAKIL